MSTADHATCCCAETLDDLRALKAAYKAACHRIAVANRDYDELADRLNQAHAALKALRADLKADHEAAKSERDELANRLNQSLTNYLALRSAYWSANCDRDELANALAAAIAERDRARALAIRLEAEAAQPYLPAQMPEAVPREGQEGAGSAPSRAADGLAGSDRHSGTPETGEAA